MHMLNRVVIIFLIVFAILSFTLAYWLTPSDSLEKADVIVAISGGDTEARTREAIRLYKDGWAPRLLFSGAALDPLSPSNAEVMQEIGRSEGVPEGAIDIAEQAKNTKENAEESEVIITAREYKTIILVTSPYHQRRAFIEFQNKLGKDVRIINHPSDDDGWDRNWWFVTPQGWFLLTTEGIKSSVTLLRTLF